MVAKFFRVCSSFSFPFYGAFSPLARLQAACRGTSRVEALGLLCLVLVSAGQRLQAQGVVATDTVGTYPAGIAVNPASNTIYVTNHDSNTVSVINGANNTVIAAVPVGNHPIAIGVNPVTNTIYVGNYGETTVSVISGVTNTVTATLTVGTILLRLPWIRQPTSYMWRTGAAARPRSLMARRMA